MGFDSLQQGNQRVTVSFADDPSGDSSESGHELILAKSKEAAPDDASDDSWSLSIDKARSTWDILEVHREPVLGRKESIRSNSQSTKNMTIEAQQIAESPLSRFPFENYGEVDIDAITSFARPIPIYLRLPNTAYGISMGLAGQAILWRTAEQSFTIFGGWADTINLTLWCSAVLVAIFVTVAHVYKVLFKWSMFEAELKDEIRIHFFNGPNLTLILLALGVPAVVPMAVKGLQVVFAIGLLYQTVFTQVIYEQWLFGKDSSVSAAKPPFLLSMMGWVLLAALGTPAEIENTWGLSIPQFCMGIATVFYLMVVFAIFNSLHQFRDVFRGSPSLTLLLAPPSVAVSALENFKQSMEATEPSQASCAVLGWALILFILLGKIGPK